MISMTMHMLLFWYLFHLQKAMRERTTHYNSGQVINKGKHSRLE